MAVESGPAEPIVLSTGIENLNELLTRDVHRGIIIPLGAGRSPIIVLKGAAGTGKSVLASVLARNLRGQESLSPEQVSQKDPEFQRGRPFPIYFSFGQHPTALRDYLKRILGDNTDAEGSTQPAPVFLAPSVPRAVADKTAVAGLGRLLVGTLAPLRAPLRTVETNRRTQLDQALVGGDAMNDWLERLADTEDWIVSGVESARDESKSQFLPIIFVDPVNFFFDFRDSRQAVAELFSLFRRLRWPLIAVLEDAGPSADETHRHLASTVEFEADVIVELAASRESYFRRTIRVVKNRHSQHTFGAHTYRIESPKHALFDVMRLGKIQHPGFFLFRSIHWYLSNTRRRMADPKFAKSGIAAFDKLLGDEERVLPRDALIVIRGDKGKHKLAIAFNLLVEGLRDGDVREGAHGSKKKRPPCAMMLFLGEDTNPDVTRIALTQENQKLGFPKRMEEQPSNPPKQEAPPQKVSIFEWQFGDTPPKETPPEDKKEPPARLVVVSFRPGQLSAEEFLWIVETLINEFQPSRLLLENTGHLRMRFPELHREAMFISALSSLTHSEERILIVTDVGGPGSDAELSYGLAASADYTIQVDPLDASPFPFTRPEGVGQWAQTTITNVRGKNYRFARCAVNVSDDSDDEDSKAPPKNTLIVERFEPR